MIRSLKKTRHFAALAALLFTILSAPCARAETYNLADDWSDTQNPNGVWMLGESATLGGPVTPYSVFEVQPSGYEEWNRTVDSPPSVIYNPTSFPIEVGGTMLLGAGQTAFHPGYYNERSVVRFTAPRAGRYDISALFAGADFVGQTTTDVHILVNGLEVFVAEINGFGPPSERSFSGGFVVSAGDTVDFAVGYGGNGSYYYDTTTFDVTISTGERAPLSVTGNGSIRVDGRRCTFSFLVRYENNEAVGQLSFQDSGASVEVDSISITGLTVTDSTTVTFRGTCTVNGQAGFTFEVTAHDAGPGPRADSLAILCPDYGGKGYAASGSLTGGNIAIHGG